MPRITNIKPSKKGKQLVLLYLDNKFYLRLPVDLVVKHRLKIGDDLDSKKAKRLEVETTDQYFFDRAVNFLSYRQRSVSEIKIYLSQKLKASSDQISKITDKLIYLGLQSDEKFADWLVRSRLSQGRSLLFIKRELTQKGIGQELIHSLLSTVGESLPKDTKIHQIYLKYQKKDPKTAIMKLKYYFASKGFVGEALQRIVEIAKNKEISI